MALVDPGDEVVLQSPRFNAFDHMVNLAGGRVVDVPTREEHDFALKADAIREVLTDRSKVLVVANPNNPTGGLTPREDLVEIAELADEHDLLVVSDEIYEKLLFGGREHTSLAGLGQLFDRTVTVNGFSKAYAMTGWRVGYLAAPPLVRGACRRDQAHLEHLHPTRSPARRAGGTRARRQRHRRDAR